MLAKKRRLELEGLRKRREAQREARHREVAEYAIMDGTHSSPFHQMRMPHRLLDAQYRRMRNMCLAQFGDCGQPSAGADQPKAAGLGVLVAQVGKAAW